MREAIGGAWLFNIVIVFVLLFAAYMALSINSSKAYGVKNEVAHIIEHNNGMGKVAQAEIVDYLEKVGYRSTGKCDDNWAGIRTSGGSFVLDQTITESRKYLICIKNVETIDSALIKEVPYSAYYRIKVFFNLDIPFLGNAFNLSIKGDTYPIDYAIPYGK